MPITSNINQANLNSQTRALEEQKQFETQRRSQEFQAGESEKTRKHATSMYNLKAGDKFLDDNVAVTFDDAQQSELGDALAVTYSNAQEELLKARDMISSGDTKKRIEGQTRMTNANNSLKKLGQELMILEQDTEEMANADNIPDENTSLIKTLYRNNVEGTTKIVANSTAKKEDGDENEGRFIKYVDDQGAEKFISIDAYKKILKGTTQRQDVNKWVKATAENLETDDSLSEKKLKSPEALETHVNSYLSDPSTLRALQHQFGAQDKEVIKEKLKDLLRAEKGIKKIQPRSTGRKKTLTDLSKVQERSQRKFDNINSTNADPAKAEEYMRKKLQGKATRSGPKEWNGVTIDNVKISDGKIILETSKGDRVIPWNLDQVNALFNEVRYTSESDAKISLANAMDEAIQSKNFGAEFEVTPGQEVDSDTELKLTDIMDSSINTNGTISKDAMEGFVNNLIVEFPNVGLAGVEDEFTSLFGLIGEDQITFQGKEYKVSKSPKDVIKLKADLNAYIKTRKGQKTNQAVTSAQSR